MVSKQDNESAIAALRQAEADVGWRRPRSRAPTSPLRIRASPRDRRSHRQVGGDAGRARHGEPDRALATVQQLDPVYVDVTRSSAELLDLRRQLAAGTLEPVKDLPVAIVLEDGTPYKHEGTLKFADVTVDPGTGSYLLRISVPNPDNVLLPGMFVRAVVGSAVRQDAILSPQRGIARDPKGNTSAMVVAPTARSRCVRSG